VPGARDTEIHRTRPLTSKGWNEAEETEYRERKTSTPLPACPPRARYSASCFTVTSLTF